MYQNIKKLKKFKFFKNIIQPQFKTSLKIRINEPPWHVFIWAFLGARCHIFLGFFFQGKKWTNSNWAWSWFLEFALPSFILEFSSLVNCCQFLHSIRILIWHCYSFLISLIGHGGPHKQNKKKIIIIKFNWRINLNHRLNKIILVDLG